MAKKDEYKLIIEKLISLHRQHPSYEFGRHISIAFSEYGDVWGLSNKEAFFALEKYELSIETGDVIASDEEIAELLRDSEHFDDILNEEDDE